MTAGGEGTVPPGAGPAAAVTPRAYAVVDVFSAVPTRGNPVAVVLDAEGLTSDTMAQIARWTNLSETTFVLPASTPAADYRVRIFTPGTELPFAGHPTLGTLHALLDTGRVRPRDGRVVQECGAGRIRLDVEATRAMARVAIPTATLSPLSAAEIAALEAALGVALDPSVPPTVVDVGIRWTVARLADPAALLAAQPDWSRLATDDRARGVVGTTLFAPSGTGDAQVEVRTFAPADGINEDPVCGSGNGSVAALLHHLGTVPAGGRYVARQGQCVGRDGRVTLEVDATGTIWVGGACVTTVVGSLRV